MDGVELAGRIAGGEIRAVEAVDAAIARADRVNPQLSAIVTKGFDRAREAAGAPGALGPGLLCGVPTFVKDNDDVKGLPTLYGSRAVANVPVKESSGFVEQYESTGLITLGKSATPEFGLTGTTEPLANGPTHNPWNTDYTPGGSSGGAAALVASGVVPLAHANDGGGSIRIPAACCGLVGLKPSRGRLVAVHGSEFMPVALVTHGVVSRSVRDTAVFCEAAEQYSRNTALPALGRVEGPGREKLRIGWFTDAPDGSACDPAIAGVVQDTAALCEKLGHSVEAGPNPFQPDILEDFFVYWGALAFAIRNFGKLSLGVRVEKEKLEAFTHGLSRYFRTHLASAPFSIARLRKFGAQYARAFERFDVLLSPVVAHETPELGYLRTDVAFDTALERLAHFIPFTPMENISGAPAIALPMGRSPKGLPVGVQFAAPLGNDRRLLELAFALEEARPWPLCP